MSFDMSKFCRALQAGFKINAGKILSEKEFGWVPVVRAEAVEKFLEEHRCEPIGDTPEKLLKDIHARLSTDSYIGDALWKRLEALTKK